MLAAIAADADAWAAVLSGRLGDLEPVLSSSAAPHDIAWRLGLGHRLSERGAKTDAVRLALKDGAAMKKLLAETLAAAKSPAALKSTVEALAFESKHLAALDPALLHKAWDTLPETLRAAMRQTWTQLTAR